MKKCAFCGEFIADETIVCPWCGRRNRSASSTRSARIVGLVVLLLLVGLLFSAYSMGANQSATQTADPIRPDNSPTATNRPSFEPSTERSTTKQPAPSQTHTATPTPTTVASPTSSPTLTPTPLPEAVVIAEFLNVRDAPGTANPVVGVLHANDSVVVLGQMTDYLWVQVRLPDTSLGWISARREYVSLSVGKETLPEAFFRPSICKIQDELQAPGIGRLVIKNSRPNDGVFVLTPEDAPLTTILVAYVRVGETCTVTGIPYGAYSMAITTGLDWNGQEYRRGVHYFRSSDILTYTIGAVTEWTVTLTTTIGPGPLVSIDEVNFPPISPDVSDEEP